MAWDNIWPLPFSSYTRNEVENTFGKAVKELGVKRLPDTPHIDWEGDGEDPGFAFNASVPRSGLSNSATDWLPAHRPSTRQFTGVVMLRPSASRRL
jgi:hypothetical protein